MISYSKLAAKIWKLVDYFEPAVIRELKRSDFEELDRQILDWYDSIPDEIKAGSIEDPIPSAPAYDLERLRIWTRLRLNQVWSPLPSSTPCQMLTRPDSHLAVHARPP